MAIQLFSMKDYYFSSKDSMLDPKKMDLELSMDLMEESFMREISEMIYTMDGVEVRTTRESLEKDSMTDMEFFQPQMFIMKDFSQEDYLMERGFNFQEKG